MIEREGNGMKHLLITFMLFLSCITMGANVSAATMSQAEMEKLVVENAEVISQKKGYVVFMYNKVKMALISDVRHDRMRIIAPITGYLDLASGVKDAVMESNFHSALDARYAVSENVLYSAFIHPMSPLSRHQLKSALNQVSNLALTFGSTYTSGELDFDGKTQKQKPREIGVSFSAGSSVF